MLGAGLEGRVEGGAAEMGEIKKKGSSVVFERVLQQEKHFRTLKPKM